MIVDHEDPDPFPKHGRQSRPRPAVAVLSILD
jgi:hypothetical protein